MRGGSRIPLGDSLGGTLGAQEDCLGGSHEWMPRVLGDSWGGSRGGILGGGSPRGILAGVPPGDPGGTPLGDPLGDHWGSTRRFSETM